MPEWKPEILRRLVPLKLSPMREAEIADELAQHLEDRYQELLASGLTEDAAYRTSLEELKGEDFLTRSLRLVERDLYREPVALGKSSSNLFTGVLQDLHYALRMFRKSPGFTAVAILTLALGIGANTAIFSIVDDVLLRPLPFKDPSKLVILNEGLKSLGYPAVPASPTDIAVIERTQKSFTSLGAFQNKDFDLSDGGEPERVTAASVSASIFPMLGVQPLLGRTYTEQEDKPGTHVAVLSYGLWQHRYAGRANIVGQIIDLDRIPYTIIGVMPKNFQFPLPGPKYNNEPAELWVPRAFTPDELQGWGDGYDNGVLARLKPGVTFNQAWADAALVTAEIKRVYPPAMVKLFNGVTPAIGLTPLHQAVAGPVETLLLVLMAAVGLVLLIACANVATLLLSRAASRSKEIAIRTALGASRMRLIRQMLTESFVLALAGGVLGILIAFWGTSGLLSLVPSSLALPHSASLGGWVLSFVATVSCLTAGVFGIAPAFQVSSVHLQGSLQESGRSGTPSRARHRLQGFFVAAEFALAMILLIGAGLLIRSFSKLLETSPGFRPDHVLTMSVPLPHEGYSKAAQVRQLYQQSIERIASLPGVKSVAASNDLPLKSAETEVLQLEDRPGSTPIMTVTWALADYFSTMDIPLIKGRFFTPEDRIGSQPVAVINEATAKLLWPGEDALGKRLGHPFPNMMRTVVGIVGDVNDGPLGSKPGPHFYLPYLQLPDDYIEYGNLVPMNLVVRTSTDPASLTSAVVAQIHSLDPQLAVANIRTMDQEMTSSVAAPKFNTFVLGLFAFLALFLAAIGIYGVLAYAVAQQSHEIGIRMALGAQRRDVMRLILVQGARLALAGLAIGALAAFGLTRLMSSLLYGISASDPLTFAAVAIVLLAVALAACYIPGRRAMRVDPMVALRYE